MLDNEYFEFDCRIYLDLLKPALCKSILWSQPEGKDILDVVIISYENNIRTCEGWGACQH